MVELQIIKLIVYAFTGAIAALFIYITILAIFLISHIRAERYIKD